MLPLRSSKVTFWTAEEFPPVEVDCILEGGDEEFVDKLVLHVEELPVWLLFSSPFSVQGVLVCERLEGGGPPTLAGDLLPLPQQFPLVSGLLNEDKALCFLLAAILEDEHLEGCKALLRDLDRLEIDIG